MRLEAAESVTEGHPDKVADQISDSLLDAFLEVDALSRVAVETLVTTGAIHIAGQVNAHGYVDVPRVVRDRILAIGYDSSAKGLDGRSCSVQVSIDAQSPDIAKGVDEAFEYRRGGHGDPRDVQGAGDQGVMFGYACKETPELMPLPISLAHRLTSTLAQVRRDGTLPYLGPDGKAQVSIDYAGQTPRLDAVVVSTQHVAGISVSGTLTPAIRRHVLDPAIAQFDVDTRELKLFVNPTGRFEIGGPMGDTGLTGRKIVVDTYGGRARHGGGAFSGKDPSKVDRSAAYAARWVAKHVVAAGLASQCEVQVSYAIGKAAPVSLAIDCFGTEMTSLDRIQRAIEETFDLRPSAIIADLDLLRPIYAATAAYGHFGRESPNFTWEKLDRVEKLRAAVAGGT